MTVLAVLTVSAVLESTLPSVCLSCKIQHNEATVAVLTVLAVSAVMAASVMTRCVTPCAAKTCAVRPVFGRVVGKLGAADPRICPKGRESKC